MFRKLFRRFDSASPQASALQEVEPEPDKYDEKTTAKEVSASAIDSKAAYAAFERVVEEFVQIGASGHVPDFEQIKSFAINELTANGWIRATQDLKNHFLEMQATYELHTNLDRTRLLSHEEMKVEHKRNFDQLQSDLSGSEGITVDNVIYVLPGRDDFKIRLLWRQKSGRTHTYYEIHGLFPNDCIAEARKTMASAKIWNVLMRDYRSLFNESSGAVSAHVFHGGRDGLGVKFLAYQGQSSEIFDPGRVGLPFFPIYISARIYERLL